jgi:hypothetical protein
VVTISTTQPVVAILLSLSLGGGVGACGLPVKVGLAIGANPDVEGRLTCPTVPELTDIDPSRMLGLEGLVADTTTVVVEPMTIAYTCTTPLVLLVKVY